MKHLKFLQIVLALTLCACTSCEGEEDKLPGTKPEMLIGKWEHFENGGLLYRWFLEIYEFTPAGGFVIEKEYDPIEKVYTKSDTVLYFTDWSYDGDETLYLLRKNGSRISRWTWSICEITDNSVRLRGVYFTKQKNI